MTTRYKVRRDSEADWLAQDPTLAEGEIGYVTDTNEIVMGDGVSAFSTLTRFVDADSGSSAVLSKQAYTAGSFVVNNTAWTDVPNLTDRQVAASAGNIIMVGVNFRWGAETVNGYLDAATIVSGAVTNYVSSSGGGGATYEGVMGWMALSGENVRVGAAVPYEVQAADIESGLVTVRLRYRTSAASNRTMIATADRPFLWWAANIG